MSQTTLYPSVLNVIMTNWRSLASDAISNASSSSERVNIYLMPCQQNLAVRVSPRNGMQTVSALQKERELGSIEYSNQMKEARAHLDAEYKRLGAYTTLAKLRQSRGVSQQALAEAIGTSQPHIARIESGSSKIYLDTAIRIAEYLDTPLNVIAACVQKKTEVLGL